MQALFAKTAARNVAVRSLAGKSSASGSAKTLTGREVRALLGWCGKGKGRERMLSVFCRCIQALSLERAVGPRFASLRSPQCPRPAISVFHGLIIQLAAISPGLVKPRG